MSVIWLIIIDHAIHLSLSRLSFNSYLEWPGDRYGLYRYLWGSHPALAYTRRPNNKICCNQGNSVEVE